MDSKTLKKLYPHGVVVVVQGPNARSSSLVDVEIFEHGGRIRLGGWALPNRAMSFDIHDAEEVDGEWRFQHEGALAALRPLSKQDSMDIRESMRYA